MYYISQVDYEEENSTNPKTNFFPPPQTKEDFKSKDELELEIFEKGFNDVFERTRNYSPFEENEYEFDYKIRYFTNEKGICLIEKESKEKVITNPLFKRSLPRGRKVELINKRNTHVHGRDDFDNIQRKLQVHFINFLIKLGNEIYNFAFKNSKKKFCDIEHKIKQKVSYDYIQKLKEKTFGEILSESVSSRYKYIEEDYNKNLFDEMINKCPVFKKFFDQKVSEMFKIYYYNNCKKLLKIKIGENEILLSNSINNYDDFIKKNNRSQEVIFQVAKNMYSLEDNRPNNIFNLNIKINENEN